MQARRPSSPLPCLQVARADALADRKMTMQNSFTDEAMVSVYNICIYTYRYVYTRTSSYTVVCNMMAHAFGQCARLRPRGDSGC